MSLSAVSEFTPGTPASWRHELAASLRENSPLILFTIVYGLAAVLLGRTLSIGTMPYGQLWLAYLGFLMTVGICCEPTWNDTP